MWSLAWFAPLLVAGSSANPQAVKNNSSSVASSSLTPVSQQTSLKAQLAPSPVVVTLSDSKSAQLAPSPVFVTLSNSKPPPSLVTSGALSAPSTGNPLFVTARPSLPRVTTSQNISTPSLTLRPTRSFNSDNQTRLITPSPSSSILKDDGGKNATGPCTGCVIQALDPRTTFFSTGDSNNRWTGIVVTTETRVTDFITYMDGSIIVTVVTETRTLKKTTAVTDGSDNVITHTTPVFTIIPTQGVTLTVNAGPTYVIYDNLFGGLDNYASTYFSALDVNYKTCEANPTPLKNWAPSRTEDWTYFIETRTQPVPEKPGTNLPVPLPPQLLQYFKGQPAIRAQFNGSDIATCTQIPSHGGNDAPSTKTTRPIPFFSKISSAANLPPPAPTMSAPFRTAPPQTYIDGTFTTSSAYFTRATCLRCDVSTPDVTKGNVIIPTDGPEDGHRLSNPGKPVTIGDDTLTVKPEPPTQDPPKPGEQDRQPGVVVGSNTLTQGQSTNINGVPVVVPSDGGGSRVVIGGTTIQVDNRPTAVPILTVGDNTVTANPDGQFVVGTATLKPGGPAITVDGSTLSLGPSGTIAVVNGITQTLANLPLITPPPAITVGGLIISPTLIGGTTQFVLGDKTLAPGNAITVDGTIYSLPPDDRGTAIIVNGITSTLSRGPSGLALGSQSITATVVDGTTAFIFSPTQTLTPGGVITFAGTTFSMPASASGSVIVINGLSSTLTNGPISLAQALTLNGKTYPATVRDGTTEFVIAPGSTIRPGQQLVVDGTTYSLDAQGTALVIDGRTSTIPRLPASNRASVTASSSSVERDVGNFVWSGIGGGKAGGKSSSSKGSGNSVHRGGIDAFVERMVIAMAGWVVMVL
ncbi:hypothetical protein GQ44DRAFT_390988 [Phaeosphaeriaceae sp. PMI808]|nr:hypothetical protein GQ44DRAFT_390988 [Phaeosphaeriaceae sp. PMI808]